MLLIKWSYVTQHMKKLYVASQEVFCVAYEAFQEVFRVGCTSCDAYGPMATDVAIIRSLGEFRGAIFGLVQHSNGC